MQLWQPLLLISFKLSPCASFINLNTGVYDRFTSISVFC